MRKSSFMNFLFGLQRKAPEETRPQRKAEAKTALAKRELAHNRTIAALRENITALSLSLQSKDLLLEDLAEQSDSLSGELEGLREELATTQDERDEVRETLRARDQEAQTLKSNAMELAEMLAEARVQLALSEDSRSKTESGVQELLLEARREAAVLLVLEREEFALEMQEQLAVVETLRGTNQMLLAQLNNATEALHEAQIMLLKSKSAVVVRTEQKEQAPRKWFFGLF